MAIEVKNLVWRDGVKDLQTLAELTAQGNIKLKVGIATVPKGERFPETGYNVNNKSEVGLIIEGDFDLFSPENPDSPIRAQAGDLIKFSAGQPQAFKPLTDARVLFIHFGPEED